MLDLATIRTVLFDMDGVLYRGKTTLPGVVEMIAFLDQRQIRYACISNNATMTPEQYGHKLAMLNIPIDGRLVLGSARLTGHVLRSRYPRGTTAYVIGMQGLHEAMFADGHFVLQEERPDLVVQGADFTVSYDKLQTACLAIRAGACFIATNTDYSFPSEEGLVPGSGTITAILGAATGVTPVIIGKPEPIMFQSALELLDGDPDTTLMIGDRLETDILGAQRAGIRTLLLLTGVTSRADLDTSDVQPDAVFTDMIELRAVWHQSSSSLP